MAAAKSPLRMEPTRFSGIMILAFQCPAMCCEDFLI
jgi:hypothetical protein